MGSGCTGSSSSSKNQCTTITSDQCVKYTGVAIPALGICTGDYLNEIEDVILTKLQSLAKGEDVVLSDITSDCDFVNSFLLNSDKSLFSLIKGLLDNQCTLRSLIQDLEDEKEPPFTFDQKCLTLPSNPLRNDFIQANINKTCELETKVNDITSQLAAIVGEQDSDNSGTTINSAITEIVGNTILSSINSCNGNIIKVGAGKDASIGLVGLPPPGTLLFGVYNVNDFDNTGKGIGSTVCGFNIANGWNNTVDMRGFTAAGATNLPGPALLSQVQNNGDNDLSTSMGQRKGAYKYVLKANQLPDHEHLVIDPGHDHTYQGLSESGHPSGSSSTDPRYYIDKQTSTETTGIEVKGMKGTTGQPIDNRPPTFYAMWIQRPMATVPVTVPPKDTIVYTGGNIQTGGTITFK